MYQRVIVPNDYRKGFIFHKVSIPKSHLYDKQVYESSLYVTVFETQASLFQRFFFTVVSDCTRIKRPNSPLKFLRLITSSTGTMSRFLSVSEGTQNSLFSNAGFRLACRSPLCHVIIACCFRVTALSGQAALVLSPSSIVLELNRIQLCAVCRCGQSGGVIDLLARRCLPLGLPSAASSACAVVQKSPSKQQCGKLV